MSYPDPKQEYDCVQDYDGNRIIIWRDNNFVKVARFNVWGKRIGREHKFYDLNKAFERSDKLKDKGKLRSMMG